METWFQPQRKICSQSYEAGINHEGGIFQQLNVILAGKSVLIHTQRF